MLIRETHSAFQRKTHQNHSKRVQHQKVSPGKFVNFRDIFLKILKLRFGRGNEGAGAEIKSLISAFCEKS